MTTSATLLERWAATLSCWFAAGCFLVAWWSPRAIDGGRWVKFAIAVLLFEFLTIHATAMLTFGVRKVGAAHHADETPRTWLWLVIGYALFAVALAFVFGSVVLLLSFAVLLAARVRAIYHPDDAAALVSLHRRVAVSAILFLLLTFASVLIPMPAGGIDAGLLRQVWPDRGTGLWEQRPQQALAVGFFYFLILGWVEARPPGPSWYRMPVPHRSSE
jgi:hypothetical protein